VLAADDALKRQGLATDRVRETPDWKKHAVDFSVGKCSQAINKQGTSIFMWSRTPIWRLDCRLRLCPPDRRGGAAGLGQSLRDNKMVQQAYLGDEDAIDRAAPAARFARATGGKPPRADHPAGATVRLASRLILRRSWKARRRGASRCAPTARMYLRDGCGVSDCVYVGKHRRVSASSHERRAKSVSFTTRNCGRRFAPRF